MNHDNLDKTQLTIDTILVHRLIVAQFPQWQNLSIRPVANQGWDNRSFHLGDALVVRMPSAADYALQVAKEHRWLPSLAASLPLTIPEPIALGEPGCGYPWQWSVYRWLEGESVTPTSTIDWCDFAKTLAQFLLALHRINCTDGPAPGLHSFHRGGLLSTYDAQTRQAIAQLQGKIDTTHAMEIWELALNTHWSKLSVWVHGDLSAGNLLIRDGALSAVIDFGQLAAGDPACDLAITWTLLSGQSRKIFQAQLSNLDADTWARARAWTLWKHLIVVAGLTDWNAQQAQQSLDIINAVLADAKS